MRGSHYVYTLAIGAALAVVLAGAVAAQEEYSSDYDASYDAGFTYEDAVPATQYEWNQVFTDGDVMVVTPGQDWITDNLPDGPQTNLNFDTWQEAPITEDNSSVIIFTPEAGFDSP